MNESEDRSHQHSTHLFHSLFFICFLYLSILISILFSASVERLSSFSHLLLLLGVCWASLFFFFLISNPKHTHKCNKIISWIQFFFSFHSSYSTPSNTFIHMIWHSMEWPHRDASHITSILIQRIYIYTHIFIPKMILSSSFSFLLPLPKEMFFFFLLSYMKRFSTLLLLLPFIYRHIYPSSSYWPFVSTIR